MAGKLTDVQGIRVGHSTDTVALTGCTVVLFDEPTPASIERCGMGTSTRQTDSLDEQLHVVQEIDAILITGGSAFGLDATGGVLKYLEEHGRGIPTLYGRIPICPTAAIFDLGLGDPTVRPDAEMGYKACQSATTEVQSGSVGAGTGASVGKVFTISNAMKGGLGTASRRSDNLIVGAMVVVNAFGDVVDPTTGKIIAGARTSPNSLKLANTTEVLKRGAQGDRLPRGENTTVCIVATNAKLDRNNLKRLAKMSTQALSQVIRPAATPLDGDLIFTASTGRVEAPLTQVAALAHEALIDAILDAVRSADGFERLPTAKDIENA